MQKSNIEVFIVKVTDYQPIKCQDFQSHFTLPEKNPAGGRNTP